MDYRTKGVCSQSIHFDIEDNKIHNVSFVGGCNGNLQGISHLVEGMDVDEAISRLDQYVQYPQPACIRDRLCRHCARKNHHHGRAGRETHG